MIQRNYFLVLLFLITSIGVLRADHATLIDWGYDCLTETGYAEFELDTLHAHEYYWSNGATTLRIEHVPTGSYTFYVVDFLGCLEEHVVNINGINYECQGQGVQSNDASSCTSTLSAALILFGDVIDESQIEYTWSDGYSGGLERTVALTGLEQELCVIMTPTEYTCCSDTVCFYLPSSDRFCVRVGEENEWEQGSWDSSGGNELNVYPNPYHEVIHLQVNAANSGQANIEFFGLDGRLIFEKTILLSKGYNKIQNLKGERHSNIGLLRFTFPNGQSKPIELIQIK